jgi:hypothetical protein
MKKVILSISAMLFGTTMILAQGAPVSSNAANYSIVTETGNNNSANIMQTGDKHVQVTQDGQIMVLVGIKTKFVTSQVRTKAVIGSHGDKNG